MCYRGEAHTIIYLGIKAHQRVSSKEFPISGNSKGAGEETWELCLALFCLAQGGCSSCEHFRAVFVQDSLAGRETKLIKEKKARQLFVRSFSFLSLLSVGLLVPLLKLVARFEWLEWQKTLNKSTCLISFYLCNELERVWGRWSPWAIFWLPS